MIKVALIPAAGRGARLDRKDSPKPLVEVGGQALVVRLITRLREAGVERFVVVVGYRGDELEQRLTVHPALRDVKVEVVQNASWSQGLLHSVLAARPHIDEPFLLAMADHIFEKSLIETMVHVDRGDDALVALADRNLDRIHDLGSAVKLRCDGARITDIGRNVERYDAVDCGLFATGPELFEVLAEVAAESPERRELATAMAAVTARGGARAEWVDGAAWFDIDTPPELIRAEMAVRADRRKSVATQRERPESGDGVTVFRFETGKPTLTDVVVSRGLVKAPADLNLIPEECASSPHFVFSDPKVFALYGDAFLEGLRSSGYNVHPVILPEGEAAKTLTVYSRCVDEVLSKGIDERSIMISLGGGVVCNVCGFIASTLYRGIGLVHVPTTLMAQCDAAISHKQAVNGSKGKNMVGSYYAPASIFVDVDTLATLDPRLIPDGLAEVVKHALGQDESYIHYLENYDGDHRDPDFLEAVVQKNIELKCDLMRDDPKELREGMVLQYGHTLGHPIEYLSGFTLTHGEAVAIGMMVAVRVSRILGGCTDEIVEQHRALIAKYNLPTEIPRSIDLENIMDMTRYNKRYLTEGTRMALVSGPGVMWSVDGEFAIPVPDSVVRDALIATYESEA